MSASPNYPVDLVLIRHGQTEDKLAEKASQLGDDSLWAHITDRHPSYYRLTSLGQEQAKATGEWIQKNITPTFDRYYASEYLRGLETAALLGFPGAKWYTEIYLREQDQGVLTGHSSATLEKNFKAELERSKRDAFYFAPVGGESIARVAARVELWLGELQKSCSGFKVVAVVHGSILKAIRIRLERLMQSDWDKFQLDPDYQIGNGQVVHYSRRNPETGEISSKISWVRVLRPPDEVGEWKKIIRSECTSQELLAIVEATPRIVDNDGVATTSTA